MNTGIFFCMALKIWKLGLCKIFCNYNFFLGFGSGSKIWIRIWNHMENFRIHDPDPYNNSYGSASQIINTYFNLFIQDFLHVLCVTCTLHSWQHKTCMSSLPFKFMGIFRGYASILSRDVRKMLTNFCGRNSCFFSSSKYWQFLSLGPICKFMEYHNYLFSWSLLPFFIIIPKRM